MQKNILMILVLMPFLSGTTACVGTVIGQTADAAIEVAKIPFKVGAAIVDVAAGDDEDEDDESKDTDKK